MEVIAGMTQPEDNPTPRDDQQDISLEELSDAFARMLQPQQPGNLPGEEGLPAEDRPEEAASADQPPQQPAVNPRSVLEAMLFVGHPENEPLTRQQAAAVIHGVEAEEIDELIDQLNAEYAQAGHVFQIVSEGAGYRMILSPQFDPVRRRFYGRVREARLSQAAIEVLALVAYRQPITGKSVSELRGHPSSTVLAQLVRRQLLRIDRPEGKPRTPLYHTTDRFLQLFGLDRLDDLPRSQDAGP